MHTATPTTNIEVTLGELYRLYLRGNPSDATSVPEIAKMVPELDYLSAFFYEDLFRRSAATDFESWSAWLKSLPAHVQELIEPYMPEIYCRGKAVFIGMELRSSGVWRFGKWNACLMAQLDQQERMMIEPFSKQIYQRAKSIMRESFAKRWRLRMGTKQRAIILAGLGLILFMLLVPPWRSSGGYPRGYHLIVAPPPFVTSVDLPRLAVQALFIVLLTAGLVFVLQDRQK
jgi:hypothetical protein